MDPDRSDLIELLALSTLEDRPLHGYGVYKELAVHFGEELTNGRVYSILGRLADEGLVRTREGRGQRKVHELTEEGQAVLEELRSTSEAFERALADLFGLEGEPGRPAEPTGPWQDVEVHRDLVRDEIRITLRKGEGGTSPEIDRLLQAVLGSLLDQPDR